MLVLQPGTQMVCWMLAWATPTLTAPGGVRYGSGGADSTVAGAAGGVIVA